ncbi:DUF2877 domain-containing protein [Halomonas saccharevitans]|uniref:DUF2877 domain-containing protein n=2 Tax=Halomonas saccharevitans TaxID=416872 RepID=A0ABU3N9W1_9GAMM|nr:DUF2877 domain-containing protein [Halomonas saccharevitans]MDT8877986.1 DUF2877 domain-containing protein [Halomonas saccharevitans]
MIIAQSCGYLCPRQSFDGQVHSVFERSVNIVTGLRATPWLSILDTSLPATPTAFQGALMTFGNLATALRAGDGAFMRGGVIRFRPSRGVQVNTVTAQPWQRAPSIAALDDSRLQHNLAALEQALLGHVSSVSGRPDASLDDYLNAAGLSVPAQLGARPEALFGNLGKGQGLTPAGDDFLLGVLAAAHCLRPLWPQADQVFQRLATPGLLNTCRTTDVSAHYLQLALAGHFSQPVQWLVYHLLHGTDDSTLQHSLHATLAIGASSGADTCAGIVYAIHQLSAL